MEWYSLTYFFFSVSLDVSKWAERMSMDGWIMVNINEQMTFEGFDVYLIRMIKTKRQMFVSFSRIWKKIKGSSLFQWMNLNSLLMRKTIIPHNTRIKDQWSMRFDLDNELIQIRWKKLFRIAKNEHQRNDDRVKTTDTFASTATATHTQDDQSILSLASHFFIRCRH